MGGAQRFEGLPGPRGQESPRTRSAGLPVEGMLVEQGRSNGMNGDEPKTTEEVVRRLALDLPGATEQDHHGFPSYRVGGRIFATLPSPDRLRTMPAEPAIRAAAAEHPGVCAEFFWGKRLACVETDLTLATEDLVRELLGDAWDHQSHR